MRATHTEYSLAPYPATLHVYIHPAEGPFAQPPAGKRHAPFFPLRAEHYPATEGYEAMHVARRRVAPGEFAIHVREGARASIITHEIIHLLTALERQSYLRTRPENDEPSAYLAQAVLELVALSLREHGTPATI